MYFNILWHTANRLQVFYYNDLDTIIYVYDVPEQVSRMKYFNCYYQKKKKDEKPNQKKTHWLISIWHLRGDDPN